MIPYEKFTGKGDYRYYLNQPFNHGEYTIASDGHTVLISPIDHQFDGNTHKLKNLDDILAAIINTPVRPLENPLEFPEKSTCQRCQGVGKVPSTKDCPKCEGEGEVYLENDFHDYTCDCKTCHGSGQVKTGKPDETCDHCNGSGQAWITRGDKRDSMQIGAGKYQPTLIAKIIDEPGLQIGFCTDRLSTLNNPVLIFATGTQRGGIMPMHQ